MEYRREIDGLRAVAVLAVILFHAGFETFRGGFVGVDVFFVISGYLITTIILAEIEEGTFAILEFYKRRARRILPALFFVMLVCIPFAWFWLLPDDMKDFAQSLVAVSICASNVLFWLEGGYYDADAEIKPLVHTWSLAVEEQYYLIFPLFLLVCRRFGKRRTLIVLGVVFVASLGLAQWGAHSAPLAAFLLLPTRAWELLLGVFAGFYLSKSDRTRFGRQWSEALGALGVVLILCSVVAFNRATPFLGVYALVPTVGTLLFILFATQETITGRLVANKAFVGIGLISYSAYLWHQPLFAFARQRSFKEPGAFVFALLSVASLVLGYLSWRYIEGPFRKRANVSDSRLLLYASIAAGLFVSVGLIGWFVNGAYGGRSNVPHVARESERINVHQDVGSGSERSFDDSSRFTTGNTPEVLVWGDSYALHLVHGLVASNPNIKLVQKVTAFCGPFLDIAPMSAKYGRAWAERCIRRNDEVIEYLKNSPSVKYVVMSSRFAQFVGRDVTVLTRDERIVSGQRASLEAMLSTIKLVKELGRIPVVFSPTPQDGSNVEKCLMKATLLGADTAVCNVSVTASQARQAEVWDLLRKIESVTSVVWLAEGMCSYGVCYAAIDGVAMYRDRGHLSREASAYLGKKLDFYGRLARAGGQGAR
jgi:peptidoglycan/LPS O-acetylase OafA/YrhL